MALRDNEALKELKEQLIIKEDREKQVTKLKDNEVSLKKAEDILNEIKELLKEHEDNNVLEYLDWIKKKTKLRYSEEVKKNFLIFNNQIYWAHLGKNIGSEQEEYRPVLVILTAKDNPNCSIIPLTLERYNDKNDYHVDLENGISTALVDQVRVISKQRIDKPHYQNQRIASITENDWKKINEQLEKLYRLLPFFCKNKSKKCLICTQE